MTASELLKFFSANTWDINRKITDYKLNTTLHFLGECQFTRNTEYWIYHERGTLDRHTEVFNMQRSYIYKLSDNSIDVHFDDDRHFYSIDCAQLPALKMVHHCAPDTYQGDFNVTSSDWSLAWRVTGPHKDLLIQTQYSVK